MKWLAAVARSALIGIIYFSGTYTIVTYHVNNLAITKQSRMAREAYLMELQRLRLVDNAQDFSKRCFGLAEMEALRAADLEDRLKLCEEALADAEEILATFQNR